MTPIMEQYANVLPGLAVRYQRTRDITREMSLDILQAADTQSLRSAADMLGMLVDGIFVMSGELDADIITNFALHGVFRDGENEVQRYCRTHPQSDPERQAFLNALANAIFTLTRVVDTYAPESAVLAEDILMDNQRILLADKNISSNAPPGLVLFGRLIEINGFWMSTGLGFSLLVDDGSPTLAEMCDTFDAPAIRRSPEMRQQLNGIFAAACVKRFKPEGAEYSSRQLSYSPDVAPEDTEPLQSERVERNAPCPCGSGKKYKKCCGR